MKKVIVVLVVTAAFTGPALAADLAAKAPTRAAPVAHAPSWTGCYVGGGGLSGHVYARERYLQQQRMVPLSRSHLSNGRQVAVAPVVLL